MNPIERFLRKSSKYIALDLGTANIRVFVKDDKDILIEPCVVAVNQSTGKVIAVGNEAKKMIGRTPDNITAIQPLKNGVISDFNATEAIIYYFIEKVKSRIGILQSFVKPSVVMGVPSLITEVEIKAVMDSAKSAGAGKVYIIEEPLAAAIGAGLPIDNPQGSMIIDIGGGTTDIALISMGNIVIDNTVKIAGDEIDLAIQEYVRRKYNLLIGIKMAEDLKKNLGAALPSKDNKKMEIKGRDLISGLPNTSSISSVEITEAISPVLNQILLAINEALEKSPPELVADLISTGIFLGGGGALIKDLDKFLSQKLKLNVNIIEVPVFSVTRGLISVLDNIDLLEKIQFKDYILR
jgi:rod shape-determining protein MreB